MGSLIVSMAFLRFSFRPILVDIDHMLDRCMFLIEWGFNLVICSACWGLDEFMSEHPAIPSAFRASRMLHLLLCLPWTSVNLCADIFKLIPYARNLRPAAS